MIHSEQPGIYHFPATSFKRGIQTGCYEQQRYFAFPPLSLYNTYCVCTLCIVLLTIIVCTVMATLSVKPGSRFSVPDWHTNSALISTNAERQRSASHQIRQEARSLRNETNNQVSTRKQVCLILAVNNVTIVCVILISHYIAFAIR